MLWGFITVYSAKLRKNIKMQAIAITAPLLALFTPVAMLTPLLSEKKQDKKVVDM